MTSLSRLNSLFLSSITLPPLSFPSPWDNSSNLDVEDFYKVRLLRDRLYLEELHLINEELQFRRDTTPVEGEAPLVSTGQNPPTFDETSIPQPRSRSRVVRPVLLRKDASSSRFAASKLHFTPSTRQTQPRFNSATSASKPRRPISK